MEKITGLRQLSLSVQTQPNLPKRTTHRETFFAKDAGGDSFATTTKTVAYVIDCRQFT